MKLTGIIGHVVGSDNLEEIDVIIRVKSCHGRGAEKTRAKDIHFFVQAVVDDKVVCHAYTVGLHGVALTVVVIAHLGVVKVRDAAGGGRRAAGGSGLGFHCHCNEELIQGWQGVQEGLPQFGRVDKSLGISLRSVQ